MPFVDALDLGQLGFERAQPAETGRPAYHPATLLKIYVYGYLNRIQSSRRLEREAQRNVELIWLTGRLMPDFKTIADFRRDNGAAILRVCREFVLLCRRMQMFGAATVAIDGSKFKAVNNRDKNFTDRKLVARMQQVEESIAHYLDELDRADRQPAEVPTMRVAHLKDKLATVRAQAQKLAEIGNRLEAAPDRQVSLTDPDARSMATSGRGTGIVGYNVQTAVDTKHHLIVEHEVTNLGHDRTQLEPMAKRTRDVLQGDSLTVLADRGYFSGEQILACEKDGITTLVPKPLTSGSKADGRFDKRDFVYDAERDEYRCPAGERAIWRFSTVERGLTIHKYWPSECPKCPLKTQCTPAPYRRVARWEHEDVLDTMQARLDHMPEASRLRRQTAEHPFATLKAWMGSSHFLTKTLPKVRTEMSLHVLAYNMKRMMTIFGVQPLLQAMRA
jgi:transposase